MLIHLRIAGTLLILLSLMHVIFPRYFKWKEELGNLSLINRQIVVVHTFFIGLALMLMGLLCLLFGTQLLLTPLGNVVCLGFGIFWSARLLVQFFVYSPELWKGKRFETTVHVLFSVTWSYFTFVFLNVFFKFI